MINLLDARLHKRFHRHLHQTWTVETTDFVFVAIKLPFPPKTPIHTCILYVFHVLNSYNF